MKKDKKNWTILVVEDIAFTQRESINFFASSFRDAFVIGAYSASEAKDILGDKEKCKSLILAQEIYKEYEKDIEDNPQIINTGCIILDIVMETTKAGFDFINYVRDELKNNSIQIIIYSGQIGEGKEIPEDTVTLMKRYNIHSIILKGGPANQSLEIVTISAYRLYKALYQLEKKNELLKALNENIKSIIINED
jgi:hypothetical protein